MIYAVDIDRDRRTLERAHAGVSVFAASGAAARRESAETELKERFFVIRVNERRTALSDVPEEIWARTIGKEREACE